MASAPRLGRAVRSALCFRVLVATVAFIVGWLVPGVASAAEPAGPLTHSVQVHAHEGVNPTAARVCGPAKRGPPPTYDLDTAASDADGPRSLGASVCPDRPPTPTTYAYDDLRWFSQTARGSRGAEERSGSAELVSVVTGRSGVAAKTADDWPILSGIVRDATRGKGNFGLGSGTASQATRAGESWVGEGYRIASDGKTLVSRDGLRTFRPPSWKPDLGKYQANFSYWIGERVGKPFGNGHLDITDMGP